MCDRQIVSSDPHGWDELVSEAHGAEKYSRRLPERVTRNGRSPGSGYWATGFGPRRRSRRRQTLLRAIYEGVIVAGPQIRARRLVAPRRGA